MADTQTQQSFKARIDALAAKTAQSLGAPAGSNATQAIISQWAVESGWGTSSLANRGNNLAGITCGGGCPGGWCGDGHYCYYSSLENFAKGYTKTLQASYYAAVRAAFKTGDPNAIAQALKASPWDAGHYGSGSLDSVLKSLGFPQAKPSPPPARSNSGATTPGDQYGSGGGAHDWYLIAVALFTLYAIMRVQPKWGVPLGYLVLLGAVLSTQPAVEGFQSLVKSIQTGSLQ